MIVIRFAEPIEVSISGTPSELRRVRDEIHSIVAGHKLEARIPASIESDPALYNRCLKEFSIRLGRGATRVRVASEDDLEAVGDAERLVSFASYFDFADDAPSYYHVHHDPCWGPEWVDPQSADLVIGLEKSG